MKPTFSVMTLIAGTLLHPAFGSAGEYFLDLYFGAAWTEDADVSAELLSFVPPQEASRTAQFDTSATFGGRFGMWLDTLPWLGGALDLSVFQADSEIADVTVVPLSLLLMLRWPLLRESGLPGGRLQPYLGLGPSLIYYDLNVDLRPGVSEKVSATSLEKGWDVRAGVAWQFHRHLALFGEYRYLHFKPDYEEKSTNWIFGLPSSTTTRVDADIDTQQFLVGLSWRF